MYKLVEQVNGIGIGIDETSEPSKISEPCETIETGEI